MGRYLLKRLFTSSHASCVTILITVMSVYIQEKKISIAVLVKIRSLQKDSNVNDEQTFFLVEEKQFFNLRKFSN